MQTGRADLDALLKVATIPSDEPVFILRAQDTEAADTVRAWAALHLADGGSEAVAESALQQAEAMDKWPIKKRPSPDHWSVPERLQLGFLFDQRAYRARGDAADLRIRLAEQRTFALARSQMRAFLSGPDARQILMLSNTKVHQIAEFFRETGEPIAEELRRRAVLRAVLAHAARAPARRALEIGHGPGGRAPVADPEDSRAGEE